MTQLFFTRWVETKHGFRPELPRNTSFQVLAGSGHSYKWALVRASPRTLPKTAVVASSALYRLIKSGEHYSPALAIAMEQFHRFGSPAWTPDEISVRFGKLIERQLKAQAKSKYVLIEAVHEEIGYVDRGEFVWALGLTRSKKTSAVNVAWVSSDLYIYNNPKSHFRLSRAMESKIGSWTLPLPPWDHLAGH